MKIHILLLSLLFPLCFAANAQSSEKAIAILEKSAKLFESGSGVEATFILKDNSSESGIPQSFEGTLRNRGNKFYISTPDTDTWFDGTTQWSYLKSNREVNITSPSEDETEVLNPVSLLRLYKRGFKVSYKGEKNIGNQKVQEVEFTPTTKDIPWKKVYICINMTTFQPVSILIHNKNGSETDIKFQNINHNVNFKDSDFVFDAKRYPGVELIDLR